MVMEWQDGKTEKAEAIEEFASLLTYETLGKLNYLHASLSETLRLYPAVSINSKEAATDDMLPDGTPVKKGSITGYVPYSMGRMRFLWGEDAAEYKPERWLNGNGEYEPQSPFKFTAFQAGPRTCLGKDSAYLQMKMTAAWCLATFSCTWCRTTLFATALWSPLLSAMAFVSLPHRARLSTILRRACFYHVSFLMCIPCWIDDYYLFFSLCVPFPLYHISRFAILSSKKSPIFWILYFSML